MVYKSFYAYNNSIWTVLNQSVIDEKEKKAKKEKRKEANETRDRDFESITVEIDKAGTIYRIEGHAKARHELNGAVTDIILSRMESLPDDTVTWTTADDEDIDFTYDEIIFIARAVKQAYADIHAASRAKKKQS